MGEMNPALDSAVPLPASFAGTGTVAAPGAPRGHADAFVAQDAQGRRTLELLIGGLRCAKCIRDIERAVGALEGVLSARLNFSTARLHVVWQGPDVNAEDIVRAVTSMGFTASPLEAEGAGQDTRSEERQLLRCLGVAGFAAANVMLLSISVWSGTEMGPATRGLLHWISALIVLPAVAYAGRPFFRSALAALKSRRLNMDVPISLAVILACAMSIAQAASGGHHAYFDAAAMLLFFLLIGRYLDQNMRARARSAARDLMTLHAHSGHVLEADGTVRTVPVSALVPGDRLQVLKGERVPVDSVIERGVSELDMALLTGETMPQAVSTGDSVFGGAVNLGDALTVRAQKTSAGSLLAEIVRLMETAEQGRARYVRLADRAAGVYAPTVHILALATFLGWWLLGAQGWAYAAETAIAVLIITCPCALGLAVPVVQVVASGLLFRHGVLVKAADGLERLAEIDHVVFDKTGTLTEGRLDMIHKDRVSADDLALAASLARASRHPLSRALAAAAGPGKAFESVREESGLGLAAETPQGEVRLGSRLWCGVENMQTNDAAVELWLRRVDGRTVRFAFADRLRPDAAEVVRVLKARGIGVELLSGDRPAVAAAAAAEAGIETWRGGVLPDEKIARLEALKGQGRKPLMVGDGLNDAPALAAAHASLSPAGAADIAQTAADFVFQGRSLKSVLTAHGTARASRALVFQNFALAALYNMIAVPIAVAGLVTPLIAAIAMSASSIVVTLNALRLNLLQKD